MKKKILIVTHKMVMGGIEKSLLSMLNIIDKEKFDITVYVEEEGGELTEEFPSEVKLSIIPNINKPLKERILYEIKKGKINKAASIGYYSILTKKTKEKHKGFYFYPKLNSKVYEEFDLAISYHTPIGFPTGYVIDNIKAKKKAIFIHGDMDQYTRFNEYNEIFSMYKKYFNKYDKIFCVSSQAKEKFIKYYPEYREKAEIFYNIVDREEIKAKSKEECSIKDDKSIKITTVGRLSEEKGQLIIPEVIKRLKDDNIDIKWYCVGEGNLREKIESEASELGISDNLFLVGSKNNPYPFINNSDIYVQTSIYEGFCITLAEAKILNKPIITTNFVGVADQIINEKTGIIVERKENDIYLAIKKLVLDAEKVEFIKENLKNNPIDYRDEIEKIYNLVNR